MERRTNSAALMPSISPWRAYETAWLRKPSPGDARCTAPITPSTESMTRGSVEEVWKRKPSRLILALALPPNSQTPTPAPPTAPLPLSGRRSMLERPTQASSSSSAS